MWELDYNEEGGKWFLKNEELFDQMVSENSSKLTQCIYRQYPVLVCHPNDGDIVYFPIKFARHLRVVSCSMRRKTLVVIYYKQFTEEEITPYSHWGYDKGRNWEFLFGGDKLLH